MAQVYIVDLCNKTNLLCDLLNKSGERFLVSVNKSHLYNLDIRFCLIAVVLMLILTPNIGTTGAATTIEIRLGQSSFKVELAITPEQRRKGLMYRNRLAINEGMLLVYPHSGDHRVWMKNMLIPIRALWIDENFSVLSVQRLVPCNTSSCPVFAAPLPARYILELSDDDHGIIPGDKVEGLNNW